MRNIEELIEIWLNKVCDTGVVQVITIPEASMYGLFFFSCSWHVKGNFSRIESIQ